MAIQADQKGRKFTKAEQAIIKNAVDRLKAGHRITAQEKELLDRWEEAQDKPAADKPPAEWLVSSRDLADLIGVTQKTIAEWVKIGMPRYAYGQYDFKAVFPWWQENINAGPEDRDETITEAKKKYWQEKVENLRIKNEALRGEYVRVEDVLRAQGEVASAFKNAVRSWKSRLPPVLAGKREDEMLPLIQSEIDQALRVLSRSLVEPGRTKKKAAKARRRAKK